MPGTHDTALAQIRASARRWHGAADDIDAVVERARSARFVLIGEASHGTHEFYRIRAAITRRLITDAGFDAVAVEADWPDAYRVNRFVRGIADDANASAALSGFLRFPQWMWRNTDVLQFVEWLRDHNARNDPSRRTGFYGLDLYSMHSSMQAVIDYLDVADPEAAARARERYSCFDHFGEDPQAYGYATTVGRSPSCESEALQQLIELQRGAATRFHRDGGVDADAEFFAEQNARLVANAEEYYRAMFDVRISSWNLRDGHMAEMLGELARHLGRAGREAKIVVWAHNSHLGDARATEMGRRGEINLGQLVREHWPSQSLHVGFTTFDGTVTASAEWGGTAERMQVRPAMRGSHEWLFHEAEVGDFMVDLSASEDLSRALAMPRLERAIGVIYRPRTERMSHYFEAALPRQFDIVLHCDRTRAVVPLERSGLWVPDELPETYPSAL